MVGMHLPLIKSLKNFVQLSLVPPLYWGFTLPLTTLPFFTKLFFLPYRNSFTHPDITASHSPFPP